MTACAQAHTVLRWCASIPCRKCSLLTARSRGAAYDLVDSAFVCMLLQNVLDGDLSWADICPVYTSGVNCMTDEPGTVDELLNDPLALGNILDYGADPQGAPHTSLGWHVNYYDMTAMSSQIGQL